MSRPIEVQSQQPEPAGDPSMTTSIRIVAHCSVDREVVIVGSDKQDNAAPLITEQRIHDGEAVTVFLTASRSITVTEVPKGTALRDIQR